MTRYLASSALLGAVIALLGCSKAKRGDRQTEVVANKIQMNAVPSNAEDNSGHVSYIVRFDSERDAFDHSAAVVRAGGTSRALDREGRVLALSAPARDLKRLEIPSDAIATVNTTISLRPSPNEVPSERAGVSNDYEAFLTAKNVTGVSDLRKRFPEADGRDMKVAVFDTGIDFGVEGLETTRDGQRKLLGFYDLSGFGKVTLEAAVRSEVQGGTSFTIGSETLTVPTAIAAKDILFSGVLSEAQLARDYYADKGIDLDGNAKLDDQFLFVVGHNASGHAAVWLDRNKNGMIDSGPASENEELTDYNSTYDFLNMDRSTPSGARPLAVTVSEADAQIKVQFHSVPGGHGTSCAIIIGADAYADGHLSGLAPRTQLLAYVLDTTGQDVYKVDEFLAMFLHAKEQQVDAISISWGFATADLASARFLADFLDREIASAGIVVAMAAGNNGPGVSSGQQDDYVPHHGFGVGAYISKDQARNVYSWTGDVTDDVIFYSSFGPTRGGRQVPDVVSPLMTLVRGERGVTGPRFYGFGGTSSATPALVGSLSALGSVLKAKTGERLDARLLKLAVQNSATPVFATSALRQGSGLVNVDKALEIYLKLHTEQKAARQDATRRAAFAYDIRAAVALSDSDQVGEGIRLQKFEAKKTIKLALAPESLALVDTLVFYEPVRLLSEGDFFETPDVVGLHGQPASFDVNFSAGKLTKPGTYTGRVSVVRTSDGLILATIPIVVEIPYRTTDLNQIVSFKQTLKPLQLLREPIALQEPSAIVFKGLVIDESGQAGAASDLRVAVINSFGNAIYTARSALTEINTVIDVRSDTLPAGNYEVVVYRAFRQPAVLRAVDISLTVSLPSLKLVAGEWDQGAARFAVKAARPIAFKTAKLTLENREQNISLTLADSHAAFHKPIKGYYGESVLASAATQVGLRLVQTQLANALRPMANVELVAVDLDTSDVLYRGWKNLNDPSTPGPAEPIVLAKSAQKIAWLAYPNVVDWANANIDQTLQMTISQALPAPVASTYVPAAVVQLTGGDVVQLKFDIADSDRQAIDAGVTGKIELLDAAGKVADSVPVRW